MKHRFLYIMALLLTVATGAWAQDPDPIDLTPSADGTVWTLSTMPEYDVELEVEYELEVTLSTPEAALNVGQTLKLTATVSPDNADKTVTWETSNANVATVSADGVVTAVGEGNCTITVTATNGTAEDTTDDKSATCAVTVGNPEYNVTMKTGTAQDGENAKWTITPDKAKYGQDVKLKYNGRLKVKKVTATTDAAPANQQ